MISLMVKLLCFVDCRRVEGSSRRLGAGNTRIHRGDVYTPAICSLLACCNLRDADGEGVPDNCGPRQWQAMLEHMSGCCGGMAVVTGAFSIDLVSLLTSGQRHVHDYWDSTQHASEPLVVIRFQEVAIFDRPQPVVEHLARQSKTGIFIQSTNATADRLRGQHVQVQGDGEDFWAHSG